MEIPRHWRIRKQRYSMVGGICPNCETKMFPAREICPHCGNGSRVSISLNEETTLYAQSALVPSQVLRG